MDFRRTEKTRGAYFRQGMKHCVQAPGIGLFAAMSGFGALAKESGVSLLIALGMTGGLWSTPGQVAFVELFATGIGGVALIASVTIANVRMFPLTIATMPLLRSRPGLQPVQFWIAHINSVTSFVQVVEMSHHVSDSSLRTAYFFGFTTATMSLGLLGTTFGYTVANQLPGVVGQSLVFITPLYMLLLAAQSSQRSVLMSVVLGCTLVPLGYLVSTNWGLLTGGVLAGTLAFVIDRARKRHA